MMEGCGLFGINWLGFRRRGSGRWWGSGRWRCVRATLASVLHLLERRPQFGRNHTAGKLDRENWRGTANKCGKSHSHEMVELRLGVVDFGHVRGQRAEEPIAQENSQEGADQRRRHLMTDLLRRPTERTHGDDH